MSSLYFWKDVIVILKIEKKLLERQIKALKNMVKQRDEQIELYKEMLEKVNYGETEQIFKLANETIEKYNNLSGILEQSHKDYDELIKERQLMNLKYKKEMDGLMKKLGKVWFNMYTWEIENFLRNNNRIVTREEFYKIVNQVDNPQITDVQYDKSTDTYRILTSDNGNIVFRFQE